MELIVSNTGFRLRARTAGPEQARRFDWRETARLTLKALERAAGFRLE
jgi:hypothetical protein